MRPFLVGHHEVLTSSIRFLDACVVVTFWGNFYNQLHTDISDSDMISSPEAEGRIYVSVN